MKDYMEHRFPFVPGIDVSGVVERVGPGVEGLAVGDAAYVVAKPYAGGGSLAEWATVDAQSMAQKPDSLDHVAAAAVPHAGLTALATMEAAGSRRSSRCLWRRPTPRWPRWRPATCAASW